MPPGSVVGPQWLRRPLRRVSAFRPALHREQGRLFLLCALLRCSCEPTAGRWLRKLQVACRERAGLGQLKRRLVEVLGVR